MSGFVGRVRTWRCHWTIEADGRPVPASHTVYLTEYRYARNGRERLSLAWVSPFRYDLTPDFECTQYTPGHTVQVHGNDVTGARAVISGPTPGGDQGSGWEAFLADPLDGLATPNQVAALREVDWVEAGPGQRGPGGEDSGRPVPAPAGLPVRYWTSASPANRPGIQRARAYAAVRDGVRVTGVPKGRLPGGADLAGLDLHAELTEVQPNWEGTIDASYRVLQWQPVPAGVGRAPAGLSIPRLIVWGVKMLTPKLPGRSFHRRVMVLIDLEPEPAPSLSDVERLLPGEKVVDLRTNRAWAGPPVTRDDCLAWAFLTGASRTSETFRTLLGTDLRAAHPASFRPLAPFVGVNPGGPPTGALATELPFRPVYFPPDSGAAGTVGPPVPSGGPPVAPGPAPVSLGKDAAATPAVLRILDQIRSAGRIDDKGADTTPERTGFQPVPPERRVRANLVLGLIFYGLLIATGAVLVVCVRVRRRKTPAAAGA